MKNHHSHDGYGVLLPESVLFPTGIVSRPVCYSNHQGQGRLRLRHLFLNPDNVLFRSNCEIILFKKNGQGLVPGYFLQIAGNRTTDAGIDDYIYPGKFTQTQYQFFERRIFQDKIAWLTGIFFSIDVFNQLLGRDRSTGFCGSRGRGITATFPERREPGMKKCNV